MWKVFCGQACLINSLHIWYHRAVANAAATVLSLFGPGGWGDLRRAKVRGARHCKAMTMAFDAAVSRRMKNIVKAGRGWEEEQEGII